MEDKYNSNLTRYVSPLVSVYLLTNIHMRPKKFTDEEILSQTRECLLKFGAGVSTQKIAAALGMSQANLFKRFGTKSNLIRRALIHRVSNHSIFLLLQKEPTQEAIPQQLHTLCDALLKFYEDLVPTVMMMRSMGFDIVSEKTCDADHPAVLMRKLLTEWFLCLHKQSRIRAISVESIALSVLGAMQHRAFRKHIIGDAMLQSNDQFIHSIVEVFWRGISPGES